MVRWLRRAWGRFRSPWSKETRDAMRENRRLSAALGKAVDAALLGARGQQTTRPQHSPWSGKSVEAIRADLKIQVAQCGPSELKQFHKFENGRLVMYSYRIDYDWYGQETGRTEPRASGSLGWSDGSPFTESDYFKMVKK